MRKEKEKARTVKVNQTTLLYLLGGRAVNGSHERVSEFGFGSDFGRPLHHVKVKAVYW